MTSSSVYHPVWFFLISISITLATGPILAYVSHRKKCKHVQLPLLLFGLCVPGVVALTMIFTSHDELLISDFWRRLFLFHISTTYLVIILFFMPCVVVLATGISLFFGRSREQFSVTKELGVMKGWAIFGIAIPLVLAPLIEELGWRGYGVDSLRAHFNLFTTSVLFGLLWALWHLPLFFVKGYYHNQLRTLGWIYVANFFFSVFVVAFMINWMYYKTDRSIPAIILFHAMLNLSAMLLRTEQFTKCIVTGILGIIAIMLIVLDSEFFFASSAIMMGGVNVVPS